MLRGRRCAGLSERMGGQEEEEEPVRLFSRHFEQVLPSLSYAVGCHAVCHMHCSESVCGGVPCGAELACGVRCSAVVTMREGLMRQRMWWAVRREWMVRVSVSCSADTACVIYGTEGAYGAMQCAVLRSRMGLCNVQY
eukprot:645482-Rhodomonas_salina.1